jgi:hypothetical protein
VGRKHKDPCAYPGRAKSFGVALNLFNNKVYAVLSDGIVDVINATTHSATSTTTVGVPSAFRILQSSTGIFITSLTG